MKTALKLLCTAALALVVPTTALADMPATRFGHADPYKLVRLLCVSRGRANAAVMLLSAVGPGGTLPRRSAQFSGG
jgi:hypothetical protein